MRTTGGSSTGRPGGFPPRGHAVGSAGLCASVCSQRSSAIRVQLIAISSSCFMSARSVVTSACWSRRAALAMATCGVTRPARSVVAARWPVGLQRDGCTGRARAPSNQLLHRSRSRDRGSRHSGRGAGSADRVASHGRDRVRGARHRSSRAGSSPTTRRLGVLRANVAWPAGANHHNRVQ